MMPEVQMMDWIAFIRSGFKLRIGDTGPTQTDEHMPSSTNVYLLIILISVKKKRRKSFDYAK